MSQHPHIFLPLLIDGETPIIDRLKFDCIFRKLTEY
jgi:hypothetical protein